MEGLGSGIGRGLESLLKLAAAIVVVLVIFIGGFGFYIGNKVQDGVIKDDGIVIKVPKKLSADIELVMKDGYPVDTLYVYSIKKP